MRRPLVAFTVFSCLGLLACEDGPTQTFKPVDPGQGTGQNDGQTPGQSDPGTAGFGTQGGGQNQMEICNAPKKAAVWKTMVQAPIVPPRVVAQLDMAGNDSWQGLTIEQAEQINCQSVNQGDQFGDGTQVNSWGDNAEVWVDYSVSTHKISFATVWPGYVGTMDFKSRDGAHAYSVSVSAQNTPSVTKDGQPFTFDWNLAGFSSNPKFNAEINEIYDAMAATYAPGLPPDTSCQTSGACIVGNFGDIAYQYFPALGVGFWIASLSAAQPTPSIFNRIDLYLAKTLPFSLAYPMLKLDALGPQAFAGNLGQNTTPCTLQLGMGFDTFLKQCVTVTGDATKDQTEKNKLFGDIAHDTETWQFDVQGVDINFKDGSLGAQSVVLDTDRPKDAADVAVDIEINQATLGKVVNDRKGNSPTGARDNHGAGLVYLEYARLVQEGLNKYIPTAQQHQLGDTACLTVLDPSTNQVVAGVDPDALNFPAGCTGFEGFVTSNGLATGDPGLDNLSVGYPGIVYVGGSGMALGLKPGHPKAVFCLDANGQNNGYSAQLCSAPYGASGDLFSTSFARVLQVMGKGNAGNLPSEASDVRFFWKAYVTALVKYFEVAGTANETPDGVHNAPVNEDDLFFDSIGAGQFEIGEYVDRRFASATHPPTDLRITADVKNGIFNDYDFTQKLYRGESALYSAMLEKPGDGVGQEDSALLTNMFGSPVLANGWSPSSKGKSAYYCATTCDPDPTQPLPGSCTFTPDPANCDGQVPPLDANGKVQLTLDGLPRLARYRGAFAGATTPFALGSASLQVTQTFTDTQQALVTIPRTANPYDPGSTALSPLSVLIPWAPKQPGVGFPVALTGTLDKFIETSQIDFSGETISANVDYDVAIDPATNQPATDGSIQLLAVETTDFLGEVFLCQDSLTGDLLGVRMYTPVATILDWFAAHPGSYDNCGIIVRYSPYGNYADYITSLTNGVRLNITQGGGYGRVVDVTLFVPGQ